MCNNWLTWNKCSWAVRSVGCLKLAKSLDLICASIFKQRAERQVFHFNESYCIACQTDRLLLIPFHHLLRQNVKPKWRCSCRKTKWIAGALLKLECFAFVRISCVWGGKLTLLLRWSLLGLSDSRGIYANKENRNREIEGYDIVGYMLKGQCLINTTKPSSLYLLLTLFSDQCAIIAQTSAQFAAWILCAKQGDVYLFHSFHQKIERQKMKLRIETMLKRQWQKGFSVIGVHQHPRKKRQYNSVSTAKLVTWIVSLRRRLCRECWWALINDAFCTKRDVNGYNPEDITGESKKVVSSG